MTTITCVSAGGAETAAYHLPYYPKSPGAYMPATRKSLSRSSAMPATTYVDAMRAVRLLRRQVVKAFDTVDLLITPTTKLKPHYPPPPGSARRRAS